MKKHIFIFLLPPLALLAGCDRIYNNVPSTGAPYEMYVVSTQALWQGEAGDSVRAIFAQDVEMINQPEPLYDLYHVNPEGYRSTTLNKHRNILVLNTGSQYTESDVTAEYNVMATPQLIVTVSSPSADSLGAFLHTYGPDLLRLFDIAERDRFVARARANTDRDIPRVLEEKFGITMSIPEGYRIRNNLPDFLWTSFELPLASVGLVFYTYPADSVPERNNTAGNILAHRNAAVSQIPGPLDGSYMATSQYVFPLQSRLTVNGRQWNELRGFWDVVGDFMGGPFVNYTTYDERTGRMLAIDGYVYSPSPNNRLGQRNYIRQIEALFMTVEFVD